MKDVNDEKQVLFCGRCGHRICRIKGSAQVDMFCVKCKSLNEFILSEGRLQSEIWQRVTPHVREAVPQL